MSQPAIEFKGTNFTLSVIHLQNNDLDALNEKLMEKVAAAPSFFNCAPMVVNISKIETELDFDKLKQIIEDQDFVMVGVTGCRDKAQKISARAAGIAVMTSGADSKRAIEPQVKAPKAETRIEETKLVSPKRLATKVVHGQVRSGQQVYAKDTDLVVIGSVSNGAEVIADGDIHIYGTLRGRAIAGAQGEANSKIYCQQLQAELVSIAGNYMVDDQLKSMATGSQSISLEQDQLQFKALTITL
ncbi:septum site-determining protein MinC [Alginatibacterium sediminis]|uniref:Probable septum site-determining protein MinC n=1 Tax=Alginatibacterium sediminis TaxID=2164068 RepID=A0A420EFY7_9ALTE|nr:septum site-determining protein MinC [Alginatibacterium sediminis]RKF19580.1 septum site-determining protein MinC [Alginatibacterium sediminis]